MNRSDFIGGSDARRILEGDWLALYEEKLGIRAPENLDYVWAVQLGIATERFHLDWLNKAHGFAVTQRQRAVAMPGHPQMRATIDGWSETHKTFIEVKHSNSRASRDSMVEWYQPQIAHTCNVTGCSAGILSYIAGSEAPDWFTLQPSEAYRASLFEMELAFWWHVENKEPPNVTPMVKPEAVISASREYRIDAMRTVDMTGSNEWASHALDYALNKSSAAKFESAKKGLKELVEADVREARGHGVCIKRSRSGSLLITEL